jgi:hypothetical protein
MAKETADLVVTLTKKVDALELTMKKLFQDQSRLVLDVMKAVTDLPELKDILKATK